MSVKGNGKGPGSSRPRRLLLCLDGVPHELVIEARERGLFEKFQSPSRLLSPFPTLTNVALSAMLRATPPNGYESLYFDTVNHELRGGVTKYIGRRTPDKVPSSYMEQLDYQEPLAFEFLVYVAPQMVWRADMRRFRDQFLGASQQHDYFAFLKGTDGLLHIKGPAELFNALKSLDSILCEIQKLCGNETEIVLFSDHGMKIGGQDRVHLKTHLERQGFKFVSSLRQPERKTLTTPAFGLCGYTALYCDKQEAPELASALLDLPGVDFSLYRSGPNLMVKGPEGTALVEQKQEGGEIFYRYTLSEGDPLRLTSICKQLRAAGKLDDDGFGHDREWLRYTAGHIYPDALANLYSSLLTSRVKHTADVLVSLRDGFYYGWSAFGRMVRLAATHGNALRASSDAFLMSTHRSLPEFVRADEARPLLRD